MKKLLALLIFSLSTYGAKATSPYLSNTPLVPGLYGEWLAPTEDPSSTIGDILVDRVVIEKNETPNSFGTLTAYTLTSGYEKTYLQVNLERRRIGDGNANIVYGANRNSIHVVDHKRKLCFDFRYFPRKEEKRFYVDIRKYGPLYLYGRVVGHGCTHNYLYKTDPYDPFTKN